jgi:hypothetical protein
MCAVKDSGVTGCVGARSEEFQLLLHGLEF